MTEAKTRPGREIAKGCAKGLVGMLSNVFTIGLATDANNGLYQSIESRLGKFSFAVAESVVLASLSALVVYGLATGGGR